MLAVQSRNDESALLALKALEKVHHDGAMRGNFMIDGRTLSSWVKEVYWLLPDAKKVGHDDAFGATLVKTKMFIISKVIFEWQPEEFTESSINAFRFLIAAFNPNPKEWGKIEGESAYEIMARGRRVYKEEKEGILQMIREHLKWRRNPECLNEWIKQPAVPEDIQNIIIVARARNGSVKLAVRDIRYSEILEPLDPDRRSSVALELHKQICSEITALDAEVDQLVATMKKYKEPYLDGTSETVPGEISINYPDMSSVEIKIELDKNCEEKFGRDVFNRARRHVEKWHKRDHKILVSSLEVRGGIIGFSFLDEHIRF